MADQTKPVTSPNPMNFDRESALHALLALGMALAGGYPQQRMQYITLVVSSIMALGVSEYEVNNAVLTAPFIELKSEWAAKLMEENYGG